MLVDGVRFYFSIAVSMFFLFIAYSVPITMCLYVNVRREQTQDTISKNANIKWDFPLALLVFIQFQVLHSGLCFNKYRFVFFEMYFRGFR